MQADHRDEGGEAKRGHQRNGLIRYTAEEGEARAQMPHNKPSQQRANAGAQGDPHIPDRKGDENADKPAKEYGEAENEEICRLRWCDNDADPLCGARHDSFWPHEAEDVATFDRDAGREGNFLASARDGYVDRRCGPSPPWQHPRCSFRRGPGVLPERPRPIPGYRGAHGPQPPRRADQAHPPASLAGPTLQRRPQRRSQAPGLPRGSSRPAERAGRRVGAPEISPRRPPRTDRRLAHAPRSDMRAIRTYARQKRRLSFRLMPSSCSNLSASSARSMPSNLGPTTLQNRITPTAPKT